MAKKPASRYVCSNCGVISTSWSGRCPQCGEWNTLEEQLSPAAVRGSVSSGKPLRTQPPARAAASDNQRLVTGISEIDDVLGGGLVAGSVNLIAGQPGIGKSTLLLQLSEAVAAKNCRFCMSAAKSRSIRSGSGLAVWG